MMKTYIFKCDRIEFTIKAENEDAAWAELDAALAREELYGFRMPSALEFELVSVF